MRTKRRLPIVIVVAMKIFMRIIKMIAIGLLEGAALSICALPMGALLTEAHLKGFQ